MYSEMAKRGLELDKADFTVIGYKVDKGRGTQRAFYERKEEDESGRHHDDRIF